MEEKERHSGDVDEDKSKGLQEAKGPFEAVCGVSVVSCLWGEDAIPMMREAEIMTSGRQKRGGTLTGARPELDELIKGSRHLAFLASQPDLADTVGRS
jgi:hypothetical protein